MLISLAPVTQSFPERKEQSPNPIISHEMAENGTSPSKTGQGKQQMTSQVVLLDECLINFGQLDMSKVIWEKDLN